MQLWTSAGLSSPTAWLLSTSRNRRTHTHSSPHLALACVEAFEEKGGLVSSISSRGGGTPLQLSNWGLLLPWLAQDMPLRESMAKPNRKLFGKPICESVAGSKLECGIKIGIN